MKSEFDLPKCHINSVAELASQDAKMIAFHWTPLLKGLSCSISTLSHLMRVMGGVGKTINPSPWM
jgi:hypothetical protein